MNKKLIMLLVFVLPLVIISCRMDYQLVQGTSSAYLELIVLKEKALKRILMVETFHTTACLFERNLTKEHPNYQGVLFYTENITNTQIKKRKQIKADETITITAVLSSISSEKKSEICYFQPFSFTPLNNKNYQMLLTPLCEIMVFEVSKQRSKIKMKPVKNRLKTKNCLPNDTMK